MVESLEAERVRWVLWLPVALGTGVAAYFALPAEPGWVTALALPPVAFGLALASGPALVPRVAASVLLVMSLGFVVAKVRTEAMRAPVLGREMRAADVRGIVELVEPRSGRGQRLTLRVTDIRGLAEAERPYRVRVRAMVPLEGVKPGDAVRLKATLAPPSAPALPGGYDFARAAWFLGIGATGYALSAPALDPERSGAEGLLRRAKEELERLRLAIGERIRAALPGETGGIAVSLITGERGGISEETTNAFRDSGLLHILSISGLHMVIMAGAVFMGVRVALAAFPSIALRIATKKWAAAAALAAAFAYLLMSGSSIPTVRAFLMIAIMLVAVILDRQALAMRNVALSALLVLAVMPESLLDPGFQMSYSAVVSLIAAYETVRARSGERDRGNLARIAFFLGGIVLSTVIASFAVAPFAVYHFHRSQQYALIANLVAIPICNLVVMPAGLVTLLLMPVGLEWMPLWVMELGIQAIMWAATTVAALPGAVARVPEIPQGSFALMVAGGLWLTLWQRRWRALGLVAIGSGALLAAVGSERPDLLVGGEGTLIAVRGADGRLAAHGQRRGGYALSRWLEHDGDARTPREALRTKAWRCDGTGCTSEVKGLAVAVTTHSAALAEDCSRAVILVSPELNASGCTTPRVVIDRTALKREGAHALFVEQSSDGGPPRLRIDTVAGGRGVRPWSALPNTTQQ
jgi:competence protein ComEC